MAAIKVRHIQHVISQPETICHDTNQDTIMLIQFLVECLIMMDIEL